MNQKNFDYLKDQVKFTGFGDALENNLKEKMQQGHNEFELIHRTKIGNDIVVADLHFKKSSESDRYFFNKYDMALSRENSPDRMEQTFYINSKGNNITFKEAYNLMNRRAVNKDLTNKEGQVYNAWLQMDFKQADNNGNYKLKQYHQNYGFDLEKELTKHPIKELGNEQDKTRLMESLGKGNIQSVTLLKEGREEKVFLEANPQFKTVNVYDSHMQRLNNRQGQKEKQESKKESQKQSVADETDEMPKATNKKRRKKQNNSIN